jgi:hypothetical protein
MLLRYVRGGSDNTDRDSTEQSLTTCLKHGMSADSEPFTLVASDSIRAVLEATIVNVRNLRISGRLRASSEGQEAAGVGLALIFPFPVGWWSMPESRACGELGAAIARFISSEPDSAQQKKIKACEIASL